MADLFVVVVSVAALALVQVWWYRRENLGLKFRLDLKQSENQRLIRRLENQKQQSKSPQPQSVYLTQLQLAYQDSQAQVQQLQSENQELKVQLGYQQRLGQLQFPEQAQTQVFVSPQVQGQQLLAQCHCSNQGLNPEDCC